MQLISAWNKSKLMADKLLEVLISNLLELIDKN